MDLIRQLIAPAALIACLGCGEGKEETKAASSSSGTPAAKPADTQKAPAVDLSKTGTIKGTVKYTGPKVEPRMNKMDADAKCKEMHPEPVPADDFVVDASGNLQWTFLYVKELSGQSFPTPTEQVVLNQKGCHYEPHVLGVMVNQELKILNSDNLMHNIHSYPVAGSKNKGFNEAQAIPGDATAKVKKFAYPEKAMKVKCDVHTWMGGYIHVMDHPCFAVSSTTGEFEIKGCPAGEYTLVAWHERLGEQTQKVKVDAGATATAAFDFKEAPK
ncbi:MAG: hypothetical protein U1E76_02325 [Planctomycetota bacterium]